MKFICEHCKTKYSIADEKVKRKVLKIRCKNCSNIIVVQEHASGASTVESVAGGGRALERAFDSAFRTRGTGSIAPDPGLVENEEEIGYEPTRLSDAPIFPDRGLRLVENEWYLAVEGKQYGPMALSELGSRIKRGETRGEAYVWRDGFEDWLEIADVPELRQFIPREPPPPPPAKSGLLPLPKVPQAQLPGGPVPQQPQVPPLPRPDQVPGFNAGRGTPAMPPAPQPTSGAFPLPVRAQPVVQTPPPQALPPVAPQRLATPVAESSSAGPLPQSNAPMSSLGQGSGLVLPAPAPERVEHSFPAPMPQPPPSQGTPLMMKITAAAGIVAALSGIVLLVYFLFIDRPAKKTAPTPSAVSSLAEDNLDEPALSQVDAGAGSLEFSPMEVELSPKKQHAGHAHQASAAPRAKPEAPVKQPGNKNSDEKNRLLALYRNDEAGKGGVPSSANLPQHHSGPTRQITSNEILAKQRDHKPELKACYNRALKRDDSLADIKAMVTITITAMGRVGGVKITGADSPSFTSCLQKSIKRWVFKPVGKSTDIKFPIIFRGS